MLDVNEATLYLQVLQMDRLNAARGLQPRRLSSTPIKSPPRSAIERCASVDSRGFAECKSTSVNSDAFVLREDTLRNKVSIKDKEEQDSGREDRRGSDVSSCTDSDFVEQEVVIKPPSFPSTLCFPAQSDQPYDKRSYQDEDSSRDSASEVSRDDDDTESDSVLSNAESTLTEDKDGAHDQVVFDDNDTWNDLEDTAVGTPSDSRGVSKATANGISPPAQTLLRKVAVKQVVELDKGTGIGSVNRQPDPPAPSQLMTRLFPSLKPKAQNAPLVSPPHPAASVGPESKKPEVETGEINTCSPFHIVSGTSAVSTAQGLKQSCMSSPQASRFSRGF